jgi:hypothetical protein
MVHTHDDLIEALGGEFAQRSFALDSEVPVPTPPSITTFPMVTAVSAREDFGSVHLPDDREDAAVFLSSHSSADELENEAVPPFVRPPPESHPTANSLVCPPRIQESQSLPSVFLELLLDECQAVDNPESHLAADPDHSDEAVLEAKCVGDEGALPRHQPIDGSQNVETPNDGESQGAPRESALALVPCPDKDSPPAANPIVETPTSRDATES